MIAAAHLVQLIALAIIDQASDTTSERDALERASSLVYDELQAADLAVIRLAGVS